MKGTILFTTKLLMLGTDISHRIGLALFAVGVIMYLLQGYVASFLGNLIALLVEDPTTGGISMQLYIWIYIFSALWIIAGVIVFFSGWKKANKDTSDHHISPATPADM